MNKTLTLPDVVLTDTASHPAAIEWVGMSGIAVPFYLPISSVDSTLVTAKADLYVSLDKAEAKGIHMSRLYLGLYNQLAQAHLSSSLISQFLSEMVESQNGISQNATLTLSFELPLHKKALLSHRSGYQSYQIHLTFTKLGDRTFSEVHISIPYSSTCPCSASLSRQLLAKAIDRQFDAASIDKEQLLEWIESAQGSIATPHSQRSFADIKMKWAGCHYSDIAALIQHFEAVLATPVQTSVKREDEQEFARLNAENLMFCEDAARKLKQALHSMSDLEDYWFKVDHQESLHAHNAVAIDHKYPAQHYHR